MICVSGQEIAIGAGSIVGGFVLVPVASLMVAWRSVGVGDFRVWLACWEARARRQDPEQLARHGVSEVAKLAGISERRAKASVRRLVSAGLVEWSAVAIRFPDQILEVDDLVGDTIGRGRGSLAIPRRMLRFLADGARPALIATVLAILLRCLSRRRDGFDGRGRVKSSWIAKVFGVDERRVKAARAELVRIGWIEFEEGDRQSAMNRWGRACRIDLGWAPMECRSLPPLGPVEQHAIDTPSVNQDPFQERNQNQDPVSGRPEESGVWARASSDEDGKEPEQHYDRIGSWQKEVERPRLEDIKPEDLTEISRTLDLCRQAVDRGLVTASEHDRLRFVALAEHARQVGRQNPCGLFVALLRRGAWDYITAGEEDAARRRLRAHLHSNPVPVVCPPRKSMFVPAESDEEIRRAMMLRMLAARSSDAGK
jgi:hypothetical protein